MATRRDVEPIPKPLRPEIQKRRKPPVEFTAERKEQYLVYMREHGMMVMCAELVGISAKTVHEHRRRDPEFNDAYLQAYDAWTETHIERAMIRRGIDGIDEPIIGGITRDKIVTTVKRYSDPLLLALARSRKVEFNKGAGGDDSAGGGGGGGGTGGGVLVVPQTGHSILEWEQLYGEKARGTTGRPGSAK